MDNYSGWLTGSTLSLVIATLSVGMISAPAYAQVESATLNGKIQAQTSDASGGVKVTAVDTARGYSKSTYTREDGSYVFVGLKPGSYQVSVDEGQGQQVTLQVGQTMTLDFAVEASSDAAGIEHINVTGFKIETFSGGEIGTNITPQMMARLPQNNRNFLAFADLAPGVQLNTDGQGNVSIRGGAQHQRSVNVFLDGVSQKDYVLKGGVTGQDNSRGNPFPQNAISEYKVITQNYKAEYDQVGSTAITAVTRSGTNEFAGDVFFDYTDQGFREPEPNENDGKSVSLTKHAGVLLAGPIIKDQLHFLVSYERKNIQEPIDIPGGDGVNFVDLPAQYAALLGRKVSTFEEDLFFGKIDWAIDEDQTLEASVKLRDESDIIGFGGASTVNYGENRKVKDNRFNIKYTYQADAWQNELRFTYEDASWNPKPYTVGPGQVLETATRRAILNLGGGRNFQDKGQKGWSVQDDFTWLDLQWSGYHVIKAGIKYKEVELNTLQQQPFNPQYYYNVEFNGENNFELVQPYRVEWGLPVTGTTGEGQVTTDNTQLGLYVQDDWEVTDRLTLNIGVRWDYEETPSYKDFVTNPDLVAVLRNWPNINNANVNYDIDDYISTGTERDYFTGAWQPRVGFSYYLTDSHDHTLFGGIGRSYDRNQFDFIQLEASRGTFAAVSYFFTGDNSNPCDASTPQCVAWDPAYLTQDGLNTLISSISVQGENDLLHNDLKMPYSDQMSLGIRSTWGDWSTEASVSYVAGKDGFNWLLGNRREDGNFLAPGTTWGQPWAFQPPGYGNLLLSSNDGQTRAKNLYLKLDRAHQDNWGLNIAYTFSDAQENREFSEVFALDYASLADYGWNKSVGVPEHRIVATGSYDLPWDMFVSAKYSWSSATTLQYLDCTNGGLDCFFARAQPSQSAYQRFDLALTKEIATDYLSKDSSFRLRFDIQNLFNQTNYNNFNLNPDADEFAMPNPNSSTNGGKRQLKLSVGWKF